MSLQTIANKIACGGSSGANTGKLGCLSLLSTPEHFIGMSKGYKIPKETVLDLTFINDKIQKGIFVPIMGASTFEDTSSEDSYNTNSSGEKRLNLQGLPEYKLWFEEGHEFYRQLAKLRSYKNYDFAIIDDEGNWAMAKDSAGDYKGFSAGHVTPELRKAKVKGGDSEMKSLLVQFLNRSEWDENYDIFHAASLGFTADDITGVNGVNLSFNAVPANTDTEVDVAAVLSADNSSIVEGLTDNGDWVVKVDGATAAISGVVEGTAGNYQITIPALATAEVVEVDLYDSSLNVDIILKTDVLYRSDAITETVV